MRRLLALAALAWACAPKHAAHQSDPPDSEQGSEAGEVLAPGPSPAKAERRGLVDRPIGDDASLACDQDEDCVLVERGDCCGCTDGGTRGVVNATHADALTAALDARCEGAVCPSVMSGDPSCIGAVSAVCADGRCMVQAAR